MLKKQGKYFCFLLSLLAFSVFEGRAEGSFNSNTLMQIAIQNNPAIQAAIASIRSAEGNAVQAGLLPNPEATIEVENFGGNKNLRDFKGAEFTVGVQQTIEVGGKRSHRTNVASNNVSRVRQEAITQILSILSNVQFTTVRYAIAKERLKFVQKRRDLANQTHNLVKRRVDAARDSEIDHAKVDIEKKVAEIEYSKAKKELRIAGIELSRLLGVEFKELANSENVLEKLPLLPEQTEVLEVVNHASQSEILEFNKLRAEAAFDLAKSNTIPDPTVGFGVRRFNDENNTAFLASISIPIPLFDRNQGKVRQAGAELAKARAERGAGLLSIREMALKTWEEFSSALQEVKAYQKSIIPSAEKAYLQASKGFSSGRFSFLGLLGSQRTLYDVQEARLTSLLALHKARANMDFLMNTHVEIVEVAIQATEGKDK